MQSEARAGPKTIPEDNVRNSGKDRRNFRSPIEMLVNTVSHMQRDLAMLRDEYRALRTPATPRVIQAPRRAALTTTSWEQYHQVFEAIVLSNGWDNDTAALQLFSHLEGDALNVAHLVPVARRLSLSGLVDALTAHYGSPGRLADYRRQFERTIRTTGEDPANFATALEMLAVKAFGEMGQTAQLRLIRDGFIAGHNSCDLRRHLDSAPPETPIRDVVDRCRVWESHADPAINRTRKPTTDPLYPTFAVGGAESNYDITKVAVFTEPKSDQDKLVDVIRRTLANTEIPNPEPEIQDILERLQQLLRESVPNTLEQTLESLLDGRRPRQRQPPRLRQQRRDMTGVICFSCGRPGHTAMRCPDFNETLPFLQPGWRTAERPGGVTILPPLALTDRRRAENDG